MEHWFYYIFNQKLNCIKFLISQILGASISFQESSCILWYLIITYQYLLGASICFYTCIVTHIYRLECHKRYWCCMYRYQAFKIQPITLKVSEIQNTFLCIAFNRRGTGWVLIACLLSLMTWINTVFLCC